MCEFDFNILEVDSSCGVAGVPLASAIRADSSVVNHLHFCAPFVLYVLPTVYLTWFVHLISYIVVLKI